LEITDKPGKRKQGEGGADRGVVIKPQDFLRAIKRGGKNPKRQGEKKHSATRGEKEGRVGKVKTYPGLELAATANSQTKYAIWGGPEKTSMLIAKKPGRDSGEKRIQKVWNNTRKEEKEHAGLYCCNCGENWGSGKTRRTDRTEEPAKLKKKKREEKGKERGKASLGEDWRCVVTGSKRKQTKKKKSKACNTQY